MNRDDRRGTGQSPSAKHWDDLGEWVTAWLAADASGRETVASNGRIHDAMLAVLTRRR